MNGLCSSKFILISFRLYRKLLILYPTTFRERFGSELVQTYKDMFSQNQTNETFISVFGLSVWLLIDLFASILKERYQEWRVDMKNRKLIARGLGILFLILWFAFWALSLGRSLFNLPIKDPTYWLLGEQFSNFALNALSFGILFGPFLVLLIFLIPSLRISRVSTGDEVFQIRVLQMMKTDLFVIAGCGVITVLLWVVIFFARLGWF